MSHRRWWLFVGLTVLMVLSAALTLPAVASRHGRHIKRENFERIELGMTQGEVEAILGQPPGDYTVSRHIAHLPLGMDIVIWDGPDAHREEWASDAGLIQVVFRDDRVTRRNFADA